MKESLLKRLISYAWPVEIEVITSKFSPILEVSLKNGRYRLCTDRVIYSWADKYDNFRKCFERIDLDTPPVSHVLVLGFGLGSISYMLEKTFKKSIKYTGIEIDEAVIYLTSKYVLDELHSDIELICADASVFVQQNQVKYDMICIDLFIDDVIPEVFLTTDFLDDVQACLSEKGFLIFNHLYYYEKDKLKAETYYETVFRPFFEDAGYLDVHMNRMMISDKKRIYSLKT